MARRHKALFCPECGCVTKFNYVDRETPGDAFGPILRIPMAIFSVGVTEISSSEYWECDKCGKIKEI